MEGNEAATTAGSTPQSSTFGLLGPLSVTDAGAPIDLPRRKERLLLAALLVEANRTVPTDRLVEAAWGDEPPAKPLTSLRACISNLRKALPAHPDGDQLLLTDQGGYRLRCEPGMLDAERYERLVDEARTALAAVDPAAAADLLDEALALVRGEPLADMAYDEFAQREIARLAELLVGGEELRAQVAIDLGEAEAWLPRVSELVAAHPLRERLQAIHMTALYQLGRQVEALRSYQAHRSSMIEELGIEPAAELQELEARILAQDPALAASRPVASRGEPTDRADGSAEPAGHGDGPVAGTGPVLVGRDAEVAILDGLAAGGPGLGFVIGESGSGKSSLVDGFLDRLAASGWRTARGSCLDDDGVPPLWPWRQVVRDLDLAAAVSISAVDEINRFDLFDDLANALIGATDGGPIAVFLDDLQWADDDTVRVIVHLARLLRTEPLIVVAAARTTPPGLSGQAATWIELESLTTADVADLVEARTGEPCDPALAADLWDRTGGNAYFVTELIDFARNFGDDVRPDLEIPSHVRELVRQRVRVLPARTAELLEVGALEVQNFSPELVADVLGDDPETVLADLKPAIDAGVIAADRHAFGRFRFDHAITRETVEADIDPTLAVLHHAALGRALVARAGDDATQHATQLSRHFAIGAPAGTAVEAVHWAGIAAAQATRTWSHRDGLVHLRRAVEAEAHLATPDPRRRCETLLSIGEYSRIVAEVTEAEEALLAAFRLADELDDAELLARAALALAEGLGAGHWRWYWNPGATATSAMRQALDRLPGEDSILRATVQAQLGADGYAVLDFDERCRLLDDAVAMVERLGSPVDQARIRHFRRAAVGWSWDPADTLEHDREVLALFIERGMESQELRLRGAVLADLLTLGDLAGARREFETLRAQARLRGSLTWRFFATQWEIFFAQLAGRWEDANDIAAAALDPVSGLGEDFADAIFNQQQITHYFQGRLDTVAEMLRGGTAISDRGLFSRALMNVLATAGHHDEARQVLATLDPLEPDMDQIGGRLVVALATEALVLLDEVHRLPEAIDRLLPLADQMAIGTPGLGGLIFFGSIRYYIARALVATGRHDEAEEQIARCREHMTALEARPLLLQLDYVEAELEIGRRGPAAAEPRLTEVRSAAVDLGMGSVIAAVDRTRARVGSVSEP